MIVSTFTVFTSLQQNAGLCRINLFGRNSLLFMNVTRFSVFKQSFLPCHWSVGQGRLTKYSCWRIGPNWPGPDSPGPNSPRTPNISLLSAACLYINNDIECQPLRLKIPTNDNKRPDVRALLLVHTVKHQQAGSWKLAFHLNSKYKISGQAGWEWESISE